MKEAEILCSCLVATWQLVYNVLFVNLKLRSAKSLKASKPAQNAPYASSQSKAQ